MNNLQVLTALVNLRAYKPDQKGKYSLTQIKCAFTGSDGEDMRKWLGINTATLATKIDALIEEYLTPPDVPVMSPPATVSCPTCNGSGRVPAPVEPTPAAPPPTPPVSVPEPTGQVRSLLNEQVFTDTSGNRLNFQNDGKPGSTEYLGPGHYRARLPAAINGVIQGQRPSERIPKGTKRRSEGSGIKVPRPVGDQVVVVKCRYKFKPQAFAANMQWAMPFQLHGAGNTGSPWFAVRIEKDGWWLATINTSVSGSSTNLRPSPKFKPEPDVWHDSEVRWSANHVGFYHNGQAVAEYNGAIGWAEDGTPYLKWLVYNSQGSTEGTEVEVADLTVNGKPAGILV